MTDQEQVERFLEAELEQRTAGGESCPFCGGAGYDRLGRYTCPDCNGTGVSQAITSAKEALAACRRERERVARALRACALNDRGPDMFGEPGPFARILAEYSAPVEERAQGAGEG